MKNIVELFSTTYMRDLKNYWSYRFNIVGELFMSFVLIFFIFFISRVFAGSESIFLEKYNNDYFLFLLTGISLLMFTTKVFSVIPFFITTSQTHGYFEDLLLARTGIIWILLSSIPFPFFQGLLRITMLYIFSYFLSDNTLSFFHFLELLFLLIITSFPFIGISLLVGSLVILFKKASFVSSLFLLGCTIFSGIFYPVEVMPTIFQYLSYIFPSTFSVEAIRSIIINGESYYQNLNIFLMIAGLSVLYISIGSYAVKLSLTKSKKQGTPAHF